MEVYIFSIQFINENGTIDYSIVEGVYTDKEVVKQAAIRSLKQQQSFWDGSIAYKENGTNGKGFLNVILDKLDGTKKRYRIETKELQ